MHKRWILPLLLSLLLVACGTPPPAANNDPAKLAWDAVVTQARGATVNMHMWGGDPAINRYMSAWVVARLKSDHDVTLRITSLGDTTEAVNKLLGEKTANKQTGGTIDVVWVNGENFRTLRQGGLLYGPWAQQLPSAASIPWTDPSVANDFGYPVDGYEAPWGRAQWVMIYNSAHVPEPPRSWDALLAWAKAHPGRFTYPAPPDFSGAAFVRQAFFAQVADHSKLQGPFNQQVYDAAAPNVWQYFKELKPLMWRGGETFPQSVDQLNQLFANGEVDFTMNYNPVFASGAIERGEFPATTRTYQLDGGTLANTHYLAVPFNAANKAGALVVANFLESPAAQIEKAKPSTWGDLPVLDSTKLAAGDRAALDAVPLGAATLPLRELAAHALPELQGDWVDHIKRDWQDQVLKAR